MKFCEKPYILNRPKLYTSFYTGWSKFTIAFHFDIMNKKNQNHEPRKF